MDDFIRHFTSIFYLTDIIQKTNFVFIGSGASKNNLFVIENNAVNKLAASATYIPPEDGLVVKF